MRPKHTRRPSCWPALQACLWVLAGLVVLGSWGLVPFLLLFTDYRGLWLTLPVLICVASILIGGDLGDQETYP